MIGNLVVMIAPVEIDQDEEASEPVSVPPELVRDPVIEIGVFPGGLIISHDRGLVSVIVIVNNIGFHIFGTFRRRSGGAWLVSGTGPIIVFFAGHFDRKIHCDAHFIHYAGRIRF